jgi:hypothetical protein
MMKHADHQLGIDRWPARAAEMRRQLLTRTIRGVPGSAHARRRTASANRARCRLISNLIYNYDLNVDRDCNLVAENHHWLKKFKHDSASIDRTCRLC